MKIILSTLSPISGKSALFGEEDGVGGDDAINAITMLGSSLQEALHTHNSDGMQLNNAHKQQKATDSLIM